jgi:hypothetical protein
MDFSGRLGIQLKAETQCWRAHPVFHAESEFGAEDVKDRRPFRGSAEVT